MGRFVSVARTFLAENRRKSIGMRKAVGKVRGPFLQRRGCCKRYNSPSFYRHYDICPIVLARSLVKMKMKLSLALVVRDALCFGGAGLLRRERQDHQRDNVGQHVVYAAGEVEGRQEAKAGIDITQGAEEAK